LKKWMAFCLTLLFVLSSARIAFAVQEERFVPVLRFALCSDTHILAGDNRRRETDMKG